MPFAYFHPGGIVHKTRSNSESVLFVSPYPIHRITGIGRFVLDLSKKLSAQGFETTVLSPRGEQRQHDGRHTEIVLRTTFLANLELSMKTASRMLSARRTFRIVHAQQAHLQSLAACLTARILGKPCVVTLHLKVPKPSSILKSALQSLVERATLVAATVCVAVGKPVADMYGKEQVLVIENGVDTDLFQPRADVRARLRSELGIEDQFVFVFAGRWARAKGFDLLVQALRSKNLANREFRTVVFGDRTPDEPTLVEDALGKEVPPRSLQFVGPVEDLPAYLNVADVFLIPSRFEGMPLGFLEALATGLPVLASDIPIHIEISKKAGCVWTFRSESVTALAGAMAEIVDQRVPDGWADSARMAAVRHYTLDKVVSAYRILYRRLTRPRSQYSSFL